MLWLNLVLLCIYILPLNRAQTGTRCYLESPEDSVPTCLYVFTKERNKADAAIKCEEIGGELFLPRSEEENKMGGEVMEEAGVYLAWIEAQEYQVEWDVMESAPWMDDRPSMSEDSYDACVMMNASAQLRWDHVICSARHGFVCHYQECPESSTVVLEEVDGSCYTMNDTEVTWYEASQTCMNGGGKLAVVQQLQVHSMLVDIFMRQSPSTNIWLGHSNRKWKHRSGIELGYYNWLPGQPSRHDQQCVTMARTRVWLDRSCDQEFDFICKAKCSTGPRGIKSCDEITDGYYQSCMSCRHYAMCDSNELTDGNLCPSDQLEWSWNDTTKMCELETPQCMPDWIAALGNTTVDQSTPKYAESQEKSIDVITIVGGSCGGLLLLILAITAVIICNKRASMKRSALLDSNWKLTEADNISHISDFSDADLHKPRPDIVRRVDASHPEYGTAIAFNNHTFRQDGQKNMWMWSENYVSY